MALYAPLHARLTSPIARLVAPALALVLLGGRPIVGVWGNSVLSEAVAPIVAAASEPGEPVYILDWWAPAVAYYADRPMRLVGSAPAFRRRVETTDYLVDGLGPATLRAVTLASAALNEGEAVPEIVRRSLQMGRRVFVVPWGPQSLDAALRAEFVVRSSVELGLGREPMLLIELGSRDATPGGAAP